MSVWVLALEPLDCSGPEPMFPLLGRHHMGSKHPTLLLRWFPQGGRTALPLPSVRQDGSPARINACMRMVSEGTKIMGSRLPWHINVQDLMVPSWIVLVCLPSHILLYKWERAHWLFSPFLILLLPSSPMLLATISLHIEREKEGKRKKQRFFTVIDLICIHGCCPQWQSRCCWIVLLAVSSVLIRTWCSQSRSCPRWTRGSPTRCQVMLWVSSHSMIGGLGMSVSQFMMALPYYYGVELHNFNPNLITQVVIFATMCKWFLGIPQH